MKERITLNDTTFDIINKMSEGNPGALTVCMEILTEGAQIDPDSALGGFAAILHLDSINIYSSRIWMLYKDVCHKNLIHMIAVLRANQLGILNTQDLNFAIDNYGKGINVQELYDKVKERLPNFK